MAPGTRSSTPMASGRGWPSWTPTPTWAGLHPTRGSSPMAMTSVGCGFIRPDWPAGTPPATPTASPGNAMSGHAVVQTIPMLAGSGWVAAATAGGAWLAVRRPARKQIWFAAAAGALLVIAGLDLLPDAWAEARTSGIWPPLVLLTAAASFTAAALATRVGCGCQEHKRQASGAGTAAALAMHRFLEGSALALAGSAAVAVALGLHAFAEGLAIGALLGAQPRRLVSWLAVMIVSPVVGATVGVFPF